MMATYHIDGMRLAGLAVRVRFEVATGGIPSVTPGSRQMSRGGDGS